METNGGLEEMELVNNWDELIKRRAITDLFGIVRDCNNEIEQVTDKFDKILSKAIDPLVNRRYSSEQYMQMEATLFLCKQYFTSEEFMRTKECGTIDNPFAFEEFIGGTVSLDLESEGTAAETKIDYDEGTKLALALISHYAEALKHKVLDSASNNMLDISDE